jgi:hypothetical protein
MFSTWIGVVLLFAFFGLLALVVIGASPRGNSYEEKRATARAEKLRAVREETTKALTTYAWVDKSKGVARIPIDDAMKLTVAELAHKTPVPANPIATPEANPPAQGAAPTSAAPASSPTASPSGTQPGASNAPAAASPSVPATPLPVHGKTP